MYSVIHFIRWVTTFIVIVVDAPAECQHTFVLNGRAYAKKGQFGAKGAIFEKRGKFEGTKVALNR